MCFLFSPACDSNKSNQTLVPFAIGMAVFCAHMLALPITGCSINPTRTFASAAAASGLEQCPNAWQGHWVFWFGPILGALSGGVLYEYCFHEVRHKTHVSCIEGIQRRSTVLTVCHRPPVRLSVSPGRLQGRYAHRHVYPQKVSSS
jgi:hypothetical protein